MSEAGQTSRTSSADAALKKALEKDWRTVAGFLREHPQFLLEDTDLLTELGLWRRPENVVEFGPAALAHLSAAKTREKNARQQLEATARANFAAQAQCHAAVAELLESRNHSDLARRLDELAQLRFGLVAGVIALEGPERTPAGWRMLEPGMCNRLIGHEQLTRMGSSPFTEVLFLGQAQAIESVALVRMAIWSPARQAILAFGSPDPNGFTPDMGTELVTFLARVIERTAERWPVI